MILHNQPKDKVHSTIFLCLLLVIRYANEREDSLKLNVFYSTPSCYLKALHEANIEWPPKTEDFFPYANDPYAYWTGYFTSRPSSKRFERIGNQFLQVCKKLSATAKTQESFFDENLGRLREEMGVMQVRKKSQALGSICLTLRVFWPRFYWVWW